LIRENRGGKSASESDFHASPPRKFHAVNSTLTLIYKIASCSIGFCATFTQSTAPVLMMAIILIGGFFRALQTTSINTLAFAEVGADEMSHATSLSQMAQRISQSLGVAGAAALLRICSGSAALPTARAFAISFIVVAAVASLSSLSFLALSRAAGDTLANRDAVA
jgi:hypothetical protein